MGHLVGKDLYRQLGRKLDGLTTRAPYNAKLHAILEQLYSEQEARLVVRMPYGLSTLGRLQRLTGEPEDQLRRLLDDLTAKGLVIDMHLAGKTRYIVSPFVIGVFEFTMMRTDGGVDQKHLAGLFKAYMDDGVLAQANAQPGLPLQLMRTLPYQEAIVPDEHVEVLDYERAAAIVDSHDTFAIGLCSCRHEAQHAGTACDTPLEKCMTMGNGAQYLVRNGMARPAERAEILDSLADSRERGLVLNADNVRRNVGFICNCCGCCCNVLRGISEHGYPGMVVTSAFRAEIDEARCDGCGRCKKACPIHAISLRKLDRPQGKKRFQAERDADFCIGCGVCALRCPTGALRLHPREQRVLPPETTFERVILQGLTAGNLQNLIFDEPERVSHQVMRAFLGAVLRLPPAKQALLGDALRSRFLSLAKGLVSGASARAASEL